MQKYKHIAVLSMLSLLAVSCNPLGGGASNDLGVVKSTTGGTDFIRKVVAKADPNAKKAKKDTAPAESGLGRSSVTVMRTWRTNTQFVYAGVLENGLYFSEDGAETWQNVLSKFSVTDIALHPTESEHVFVSGQATGRARVLETKDRGKSWQEIYNDAVPANSARAVVLDPSNPSSMIVGLRSGNVIASTDGGLSWTLLQNTADTIEQIIWHESGALYIVAKTKGVYRSLDGGRSVSHITKDLSDVRAWQERLTAVIPDNTGNGPKPVDMPERSATEFYSLGTGINSQLIYVGANNGLFVSTDQGNNWTYLKLPLQGYTSAGVRTVAVGGGDTQLYAAVGNTIFRSNNNGQSWAVAAIATSGVVDYILVDPQTPTALYAGLSGIR